jgi:hypothetical protein
MSRTFDGLLLFLNFAVRQFKPAGPFAGFRGGMTTANCLKISRLILDERCYSDRPSYTPWVGIDDMLHSPDSQNCRLGNRRLSVWVKDVDKKTKEGIRCEFPCSECGIVVMLIKQTRLKCPSNIQQW